MNSYPGFWTGCVVGTLAGIATYAALGGTNWDVMLPVMASGAAFASFLTDRVMGR